MNAIITIADRLRAHDLLMMADSHVLWNKEYYLWTKDEFKKLEKYVSDGEFRKVDHNKVSIYDIAEFSFRCNDYSVLDEIRSFTGAGRRVMLFREDRFYAFPSVVAAAEVLKLKKYYIYECLNGKVKAGNDIWYKVDDFTRADLDKINTKKHE